jgi:hypothetical protein
VAAAPSGTRRSRQLQASRSVNSRDRDLALAVNFVREPGWRRRTAQAARREAPAASPMRGLTAIPRWNVRLRKTLVWPDLDTAKA